MAFARGTESAVLTRQAPLCSDRPSEGRSGATPKPPEKCVLDGVGGGLGRLPHRAPQIERRSPPSVCEPGYQDVARGWPPVLPVDPAEEFAGHDPRENYRQGSGVEAHVPDLVKAEPAMVIILIRRFIRFDREQEFLQSYRRQAPNDDPAFHGETLTKVNDGPHVPGDMKSLSLRSPNCLTYLNVARWDSWNACREHFAKAGVGFDPHIETAPAEQSVLDVIERSAGD
jgi:hypothetical protein